VVNGGSTEWQGVSPFHASVENTEYLAFMVLSAVGGNTAGYRETEAEFCAAMQAELDHSSVKL
jgi:hypothetical protein